MSVGELREALRRWVETEDTGVGRMIPDPELVILLDGEG